MEKTFYHPVGRCIYCGATEYDPKIPGSPLHEEHIIQFSLNGDLVLPEASCRKCEVETHKYEGVIARTMFGNFRMRHKMRTRRPRQRPSYIEIGIKTPTGKTGKARVPIDEYPAPLFTFVFEKPGILQGRPESAGLSPTFARLGGVIAAKAELDRLISKYNWDGAATVRGTQIELARMLAKAGYSYAVAALGAQSFYVYPLLLDIILNRSNNVSHLVGGETEAYPAQPSGNHLLQVSYVGIVPDVKIIVSIRLFASLDMPIYHVVVGTIDVENKQHIATITEKLQYSQPEELALPIPKIGP